MEEPTTTNQPRDWASLDVTPLMQAARRGDATLCRSLLDEGAEVNAADKLAWTALLHAAAQGHVEVVDLLLEARAYEGWEAFDWATPLHAAVAGRHTEVVHRLIKAHVPLDGQMQPPPKWSAGTPNLWTPIGMAASNCDGPTFEALAAAGAYRSDRYTALFMHRAFEAMGRTPVLRRQGGTKRFLFADDEVLIPDFFTVGKPFVRPPDIPACLESCFEADGAWGGEVAAFKAETSSKKKLYKGAKPEHFDLRHWDDRGSSIGLQRFLHEGHTEQMSGLLVLCAQAGRVQLVRLLLDSGAICDDEAISLASYYQHKEVMTLLAGQDKGRLGEALCKAAYNQDAATVEALLAKGADPCAEQGPGNALIHATRFGGQAPVTWLLLDAGAPPNSTDNTGMPVVALQAARGTVKALRLLLEAGADPNAATPGRRLSALHYAVHANDLEKVSALLAFGAKPNARDRARCSPLLSAAAVCSEVDGAIIDLLLEAGAKLEMRDRKGRTPLLAALDSGNRTLANALLRAGADATAVDRKGRSCLTLAASGSSGQSECIGRLVRAGADVNERYEDGDSVLLRACRENHYQAIEPLIKAGADIHTRGPKGDTALSLARKHCPRHWIDMLIGLGAPD